MTHFAPCAECGADRTDRSHRGAHGWCAACYHRWYRAGKPEGGPPKPSGMKAISAGLREEVLWLVQGGESVEQAAARVGVAIETAERYVNPPPPRGDAGQMCTPVSEPLRTQTANGTQSLIASEHLLVPYYGNGNARPAGDPIGTLPTRDRYAVVEGAAEVDLDDVLFRMLEPHEIGAAMAFAEDYIVLGSKRQRVRQYGNAVTPPVAEVLMSALVEAITGEELEVL